MKKIAAFSLIILAIFAFSACGKNKTPYIGENGNWWVGKTDLGVSASGEKGEAGPAGAQGEKGDVGDKGEKGDTGATGATGSVGPKGDDGAQGAQGAQGEPGITPHIGQNGNWWIGEVDTGIFVGAYAEPCSDGLVFEFQTLGGKAGAVVVGYRGSDTEVIIPNAFSTVPVIGIEASAFAYNTAITSLRLSANTSYLADGVFEGCASLVEIDFNGAPIKEIPKSAFSNTALREVLLPNGVESIAPDAFSRVMNTVVYIPASDSFEDSARLVFASDALPVGLEKIASGERSVRYVLGIEGGTIVYDVSTNSHLALQEDGYCLIRTFADISGTLVLPSFFEEIPVYRICAESVICGEGVTSVVIGESVSVMEPSAIVSSHPLRSVYFPASVNAPACVSIAAEVDFYLFGAQSVPSGFPSEKSYASLEAGAIRSNESYLYVLHEKNAVSLLRFFGDVQKLSIPAQIEGKSVTAIKTGFFRGYYTSEIYVPDTVYSVEKHSFIFLPYEGTNRYAPATFYFGILDPALCAYDTEFMKIDAEDHYAKTVYFGGDLMLAYPGWGRS